MNSQNSNWSDRNRGYSSKQYRCLCKSPFDMLMTYLSDRLDGEPDLPQVLTWQGNSMVEGEPHKLSVVSSILTPATKPVVNI